MNDAPMPAPDIGRPGATTAARAGPSKVAEPYEPRAGQSATDLESCEPIRVAALRTDADRAPSRFHPAEETLTDGFCATPRAWSATPPSAARIHARS
jgi:hypothetical protein